MTSTEQATRTLIEAGQILEHQGQGDMTRGHLSIRHPAREDLFLMKPHGVGFDEVTFSNVLTIDLRGDVVEGDARRHSEVFIHSEIFRARSDVRAVIHTHPTHLVALSATGKPLRALCQGGAVFAGSLPVYTDTIDLIRTQEMGQGVARALGQYRAVLLKNHGLVMTGANLEEAVVLCIMIEEAARVQLLAEGAGTLAPEFPREDVFRLREKLLRPDQFIQNFAYLARKAAKSQSPAAAMAPR
jgi:L-fuculose-phosphate aldolase